MRTSAIVGLGVAISLVFGCDTTLSPTDLDVRLSTDEEEYAAAQREGAGTANRYGFSVIVRAENRSPGAIYLARCTPESGTPIYGIQALEDGETVAESAYDPGWACVGHSNQFRLPPGTVRVDTLHFTGPTAVDGRTGQLLGSLEGRMRIVYGVQMCSGDGSCLAPNDAAVSNSFMVRTESP